MTVEDLINKKDYDYIEWRIVLPGHIIEEVSDYDKKISNLLKKEIITDFSGSCKSINGQLISLDGAYYPKETKVLYFEEWSDKEIKNGLTIVYEGNWIK